MNDRSIQEKRERRKARVKALFDIVYGRYITRKFNVHLANNDAAAYNGSYILLCNHVTDYDGLILQYYIDRVISFIINDRVFRYPLLGRMLRGLDMIPKKKFTNDIKTVKAIYQAKKYGNIIGIYPEGRRNWDGRTTDLVESTATLIRSLKLPVFAVKIQGAWLANPRWRKGRIHRGRTQLSIDHILTPEQIKQMDTDQILLTIQNSLQHDDVAYAKAHQVQFHGSHPALGLERLLFICPQCYQVSTLHTTSHSIICRCGQQWRFDTMGHLHGGFFDTIGQWTDWQRDYMGNCLSDPSNAPFTLSDQPAALHRTIGYAWFRKYDTGTVTMTRDEIKFAGKKGIIAHPIHALYGCCVQLNRRFEFNVDGVTYSIRLHGRGNAYKYSLMTKVLQALQDKKTTRQVAVNDI